MIRQIRKYSELNENKYKFHNLWDSTKAVLRGKFIASNAYSWKKKLPKTNYLSFYLTSLKGLIKRKAEQTYNKDINKK